MLSLCLSVGTQLKVWMGWPTPGEPDELGRRSEVFRCREQSGGRDASG